MMGASCALTHCENNPWMLSVCLDVLRNLFCHAPKRLSFNGNSEVNKVVPVAFVIYNTLSISASSELDSLLDSEGQPKVTRC